MRFEVDILIQEPVTVQVDAKDETEAVQLALDGKGTQQPGISYTFGEAVDVRIVP